MQTSCLQILKTESTHQFSRKLGKKVLGTYFLTFFYDSKFSCGLISSSPWYYNLYYCRFLSDDSFKCLSSFLCIQVGFFSRVMIRNVSGIYNFILYKLSPPYLILIVFFFFFLNFKPNVLVMDVIKSVSFFFF